MEVTLIDYTGKGMNSPSDYAAQILVFTKQTRLEMNCNQWDRVQAMPREALWLELEYMAGTIPSSWEFIDYTFLITGVTRAFTHQLVRTRTASYAQQTMRVLDVTGWDYATGPTILSSENNHDRYCHAMSDIATAYSDLIEGGVRIEDARGILPTNILTNIVVKMDLRTLVSMCRKRASSRTQGEYRDVIGIIKERAKSVHHWVDIFLEQTFDVAAKALEDEINSNKDIPMADQIRMIKLIDRMRECLS